MKTVKYCELAALRQYFVDNEFIIVLITGVFDHLHDGHKAHITFAKQLFAGRKNCLFVGICRDATVMETKGSDRPFITQGPRAQLLAEEDVDYVVISEEPDCEEAVGYRELIRQLKPHFYITPLLGTAFELRCQVCLEEGVTLIGCLRMPPTEEPDVSSTKRLTQAGVIDNA